MTPGTYEGWTSYTNFRTNPAAPVSFNDRVDLGRFLSGQQRSGPIGVSVRQGSTFAGSLSIGQKRVRLPDGDVKTTLT